MILKYWCMLAILLSGVVQADRAKVVDAVSSAIDAPAAESVVSAAVGDERAKSEVSLEKKEAVKESAALKDLKQRLDAITGLE